MFELTAFTVCFILILYFYGGAFVKLVIDTPGRIAQIAAQQYVDLLQAKPNAVLGFATGSTPLDLYAELTRLNQAGDISFRNV